MTCGWRETRDEVHDPCLLCKVLFILGKRGIRRMCQCTLSVCIFVDWCYIPFYCMYDFLHVH